MNYSNINDDDNQDLSISVQFLVDKSASGKVRPWKEKRMSADVLSCIYSKLGNKYGEYYMSKARRIEKCGDFLQFKKMENGLNKLVNGNFCRVRLCPTCGWRRSLKIYSNVSKIMGSIKECQYIFLTLTVKNCEPDSFNQMITKMLLAWNRFMGYKEVKKMCKGWYRGLEITHNVGMDTYHPHFHVVIVVTKSYFKSRDYISQLEWMSMWKLAMRLDYCPGVDVRKVKGVTAKAVAEIAKYTVKETDYIDPEDLVMSERAVKILDEVLHKRRLVAFGGIMKKLHKELNLDDEVDGSLEVIDNDNKDDMRGIVKDTYAWNTGYRNYVRID